MEQLHTPGPWTLEYDDNGFYYIDAKDRPSPYIVATGGESDTDVANAKLISAAPDMFEVVKGLYEWAIKTNTKGRIFPKLEAAYLKATK